MSHRTVGLAALLLTLLVVALPARAGQAGATAESRIEFLPAGDEYFPAAPAPDAVQAPPEGQVLVIGRLSGTGFAVDEPAQVEVLGPDGKQIPLRVEADRIWRDPIMGNRIISMDFSFLAGTADVTERAGLFLLRWGSGVNGPAELTGPPALDPGKRDSYREFSLVQSSASATVDGQSSTLTVIAESNADYYFLWYLLPMLVIVALLVVRKFAAGAGGSDADGAPDARHPR